MSSPLAQSIADLSSAEASKRLAAAGEIYRLGRAAAGSAISNWWAESELSGLLLGPHPAITVGLAVERDTFGRIRIANGTPRLAEVPGDQDAEEFELRFPDGVFLDLLTTREPGGSGAIAKYLAKFGEGVQQVEYRCTNVDRATQILKDKIRSCSCLSCHAAWRGWHANQFFPRRLSRWRQGAHRTVRITVLPIDIRTQRY